MFRNVAMGMMLAAGLLGIHQAVSLNFIDGALAATNGRAAQQQADPENTPTDITADNMEIHDEKNLIIFSGNVRAKEGDTLLRADRLEVHTMKEKNAKGQENTRMRQWVATGNVRIDKPNMTITGKKAVMDIPRDVLTVTGNVLVKQPDATIEAVKLVTNLKTGVTHITAGKKKRVHGIFR